VLLAARAEGIFKDLPLAQTCELGVDSYDDGYGWPDGDDRGFVNLADESMPQRRLAPGQVLSDEKRAEADAVPYTVWVEWTGKPRLPTIAAVASATNVGSVAARELLHSGKPIARGVKAPEVLRLAALLRKAGLDVGMEPKFRWKLP
jgi:hypothetical protein